MEDKKVMERFLQAEISNQDLYEGIYKFIISFHIRNGEFEGNEFIVKKIDHENFLLYPEYIDQNGNRSIHYARAVYKKDLLKEIQAYAKKRGLHLID